MTLDHGLLQHKWGLSPCVPHYTLTFWPLDDLLDSSIQTEAEALQTCCEACKTVEKKGCERALHKFSIYRLGHNKGLLLTAWMDPQTLSPPISISAKTILCHNAPGWVITMTNPGLLLKSNSCGKKRKGTVLTLHPPWPFFCRWYDTHLSCLV